VMKVKPFITGSKLEKLIPTTYCLNKYPYMGLFLLFKIPTCLKHNNYIL